MSAKSKYMAQCFGNTSCFFSLETNPRMPSGVVHGGDAADMEDELLDPGQFLCAMSSTSKFSRVLIWIFGV